MFPPNHSLIIRKRLRSLANNRGRQSRLKWNSRQAKGPEDRGDGSFIQSSVPKREKIRALNHVD